MMINNFSKMLLPWGKGKGHLVSQGTCVLREITARPVICQSNNLLWKNFTAIGQFHEERAYFFKRSHFHRKISGTHFFPFSLHLILPSLHYIYPISVGRSMVLSTFIVFVLFLFLNCRSKRRHNEVRYLFSTVFTAHSILLNIFSLCLCFNSGEWAIG